MWVKLTKYAEQEMRNIHDVEAWMWEKYQWELKERKESALKN